MKLDEVLSRCSFGIGPKATRCYWGQSKSHHATNITVVVADASCELAHLCVWFSPPGKKAWHVCVNEMWGNILIKEGGQPLCQWRKKQVDARD